MARQKVAEKTHAMPSTQKKKRKVIEEEPKEEPVKQNNGQSGWEELEAVDAPQQGNGKISSSSRAALNNLLKPRCYN